MENGKKINSLTNLASNIYCIQMYQWNKYMKKPGIKPSKSLIEEKSVNYAYMVIDTIMEVAEELGSEDKKQAFYELMENNHIIMAGVYKIRNEFYNSDINVLCEKAGLPELDDKMTSEDAMIKLCELAESKNCSRLQKALDILVKHGDDLIIVDKDGMESNASNLGLKNDDIKSLQLLTRIDTWGIGDFSEFLMSSVYGSIYNFYNNNRDNNIYFSLYNLYVTVFDMSTYIDENKIDIEAYKKENISKIKEYLNELTTIKSFGVINPVPNSKIYSDIKNYNNFNDEKFIISLIPYYIAPVRSFILTNRRSNGLFNMQSIRDFFNRNNEITVLLILGVFVFGANMLTYVKLRQPM
ncbi:hypothetical protein NEPAR06_0468 [Nematocida parisii]|uniref:Uncharacterized protein n=1 Tax=Nematocida parisii (strain ERTm3) TaxID=935791 RepID=I3EJI9_NEMP3|nr:uncharacterized protein NEPG_01084 [Nematocida parisii ERTm1]EIJ89386.1 hypothetical protein NEQG_00156 [Nematocida parisii ERTm3]KAI5142613.1 hypothetical protein NEPAR07_0218 [Nematocida parisii]EIJ94416.1 hypothetical protein NEPG_01084 [Nematocida parisii ERTm1]KAI5153468.1 hypothetical protein NEPAR06_0468 [Nematocida parisii]KAI5158931.1 hypothetical protein NEPAR05_2278 [Nematocida parisii]|eukprot:XP_013058912.1 hypothetical protein NEPG_01084 [Nematocida parisii ERTm1]